MAESVQHVPSGASPDTPGLRIDFAWKKFKSSITDAQTGEPFLIVKYKANRRQLEFQSATDDNVVGNGQINYVSINCEAVIRGRRTQIKALKRFKTQYTFLSHAYSTDPDKPAVMTWESSSNWKTWDFICLDEQKQAVAKFSCKIWGMKNIANIEFVGDLAHDKAAREEIAIVGMTLMYCMAVRTSSLASLFGALFARPGPIEDKKKE